MNIKHLLKNRSDTDENQIRINRILNKLKLVKKRKLSSFGSQTHQFKLNKKLTESEIQKFEIEQGITLPSAYRTFLQFAGDGGAGPYYGIYPLKNWNNFATWIIDNVPDNYLQRSSYLKPGWNKMPEFSEDEILYEQQHIDLYQGTLSIGTQGCTDETLLVITGEYRGRVVYADADDNGLYLCREKDFLSWYERWLDEMLNGYNTHSFGYGPGGDANDFFRLIETSVDEDEIAEAFYAFSRLPQVNEKDKQRLITYKQRNETYIKEALCRLAWKINLPYTDEEIETLLNDPEGKIRKEAILLAAEKNPVRFRKKLFNMILNDPDKKVVEGAYWAINRIKSKQENEKAFTHEECRQMMQSKHQSIRYWVASKRIWIEEDADMLIQLLSDTNAMVRAEAISSLHHTLKSKKAIPHILHYLQTMRNIPDDKKEYDNCYGIERAMYLLGELGNTDCVPELLLWTTHPEDDFYRINAVGAIAQIGDEQVIPIAQKMLHEEKCPERKDMRGFTSVSSIHPIKKLVKDQLQKSPNENIRSL